MFIGLLSFGGLMFSDGQVVKYAARLKCLSFNNQPYQARPTFININFNERLFCLFIVSVNTWKM